MAASLQLLRRPVGAGASFSLSATSPARPRDQIMEKLVLPWYFYSSILYFVFCILYFVFCIFILYFYFIFCVLYFYFIFCVSYFVIGILYFVFCKILSKKKIIPLLLDQMSKSVSGNRKLAHQIYFSIHI